uniref:DNA-directed DNA polymerase n=1 Tax=Chenopodium quinoa TaxID=63459 RepID=A0A803MIZ6_CHEQI
MNSGSAWESAGNNKKEGVHVAAASAPFLVNTTAGSALYMVSYHTVTTDDNIHWAQPKNSVVQLSAAITACARIYMHPFISRDDCYYTDTNSIVFANPLPEGLISSKVLGLFKLEDKIKEGYFLAPKAYGYIFEEDTNVIKFKGPAKHLVDISWFREQLANPSHRMKVQIKNEFGIDWDNQTVGVKEYDYSLGIKLNSKRITQPDRETLPIEVNDMCGVAKSLFKNLMKLQTTNTLLNEKLSQKERDSEKRMDGVIVEEIKKIEYLGINIETTLTEESTQLDKEESDVTKTDSKKPDT